MGNYSLLYNRMGGLCSKNNNKSPSKNQRSSLMANAKDFPAFYTKLDMLEMKFKLEKVLGRGAFGMVSKVVEMSTRKVYACKTVPVLPGHSVTDVRQEILDEMKILTQLDHPCICRVHELIEDKNGFHLIMDLSQGKSLLDYLKEEYFFAESEVAIIMQKTLLALATVHARKIAHRDIKPDNIMWNGKDQIQVIDFGVSIEMS